MQNSNYLHIYRPVNNERQATWMWVNECLATNNPTIRNVFESKIEHQDKRGERKKNDRRWGRKDHEKNGGREKETQRGRKRFAIGVVFKTIYGRAMGTWNIHQKHFEKPYLASRRPIWIVICKLSSLLSTKSKNLVDNVK